MQFLALEPWCSQWFAMDGHTRVSALHIEALYQMMIVLYTVVYWSER